MNKTTLRLICREIEWERWSARFQAVLMAVAVFIIIVSVGFEVGRYFGMVTP